MSRQITIIMYHYVRDRAHSRYPELKCLDSNQFQGQLDHLQRHYAFVSAEDLARALDGGPPLPERACLLTFDDGYLDHYITVFPELAKRGLPGAFYPPVLATQRRVVMEVNKIQLILAQNGYARVAPLVAAVSETFQALVRDGDWSGIPDYAVLYERYARPSRYDCAEVMFIKALLQYALPPALRTALIEALFTRIVPVDEGLLAQELYMSIDMLRIMSNNGMHVGSHGDRHRWLDKLSAQEQREEIDVSLAMLRNVHGRDDFIWSICYPFGGVNDTVQEICAARNCAFGLVTQTGTAAVDPAHRLALARYDTNDFPVGVGQQG